MKAIIRKPEINTMNHLFESFFRDEPLNWTQQLNASVKAPAVNITENENSYQLELLVPGFSKEQIKIEFEKGLITLSGDIENQSEQLDTKYHRKEFNRQSFKRSFQFKENEIDEESISAKFIDGILHLVLPKKAKEEVNLRRTIEIS